MPIEIQKRKYKDILITAGMGIGNFINLIPTLRSIRYNYPNAKITLLCWSTSSHLKLIDNLNIYDKKILIDKKSRISIWYQTILFYFKHFDLVIVKWHNTKIISRILRILKKSTNVGHTTGAKWVGQYDD